MVDFAVEFPENEISIGQLILSPGESLFYSREMVGGLTVELSSVLSVALAEVRWDGRAQVVTFPEPDIPIQLSLPGWTWGSPSLIYRTLGYLGIITDCISVFGVLFILIMMFFLGRRSAQTMPIPDATRWSPHLDAASILLNTVVLLLAVLYSILFSEQLVFIMLLFAAGILIYIRTLLRLHPQWVYRIVIVILLIGVAINGYLWLRPINELHQVILSRPYDSFEYLADRIGALNATYLSIGYYKYLRGSSLILPETLYEELQLDRGRLDQLNLLDLFDLVDYKYQLTEAQFNQLLALGNWFVWPNRTGGDYYLLPSVSAAGDTYYFFSYDLHYFLLPSDFIKESGVINVSLPD